ncbi:hypothetical protein HOLleu_45163 [Holothuria leucospilota]|uniref:Transposable element P transposase-like RNase H domain-containing protein n=1 Tax=Holothuria leucospilota TaxID=206669 RepID=A0A9Q1B9V6_HOLLE|nr:hypothetical protein HOLleu_45163 [Holothuria leucospilota]
MPDEPNACGIEELKSFIPSNALIQSLSPDKLELALLSSMYVNGNIVMMHVIFCHQHWDLKVRDTTSTCRTCQHICFQKDYSDDHTVELSEDDNKDMMEIFNLCFPNAPHEMKKIMQSQYEALGKQSDKRGIRWDKTIISLCLSLWIRSPKTYEDLRDSEFLILPSGRQLRKYKNIVPQESGINKDVFRWMYEAGNQDKIPANGRRGLLIHDETKLQDDLVMKMENGIPKLVGWVDCGPEATNMRILKEGDVTQKVASDVLQIYFLGYTGFRWPICHFPTTGVTASELYITIWKIISELQDWGFYVDCILQDGGSANRQFMNLHFTGLPSDSCFISCNIVNPTRLIAFTQDFSHIVKKIRNGIMKSGNNSSVHTRKLQVKGQYILWQQWHDMVKWDRMTNSRLINHKITDAHLFPDSGEKMRNHLAEEMLNADALNLMKCYKSSLANGSVLDGAVALLEQTSAMIAIFRDNRPIREMADERLAVLGKVCKWFQEWRKEALSNEEMCRAERNKCILSMECCDDIESLLLSFPKVCQMHLEEFPSSSIVPARFNSDIIENHFCQQRGIHNGNATSMTYYEYCSTQNAIILGQSLKSKGRKSNTGLCAAKPFSFYTNRPLKR